MMRRPSIPRPPPGPKKIRLMSLVVGFFVLVSCLSLYSFDVPVFSEIVNNFEGSLLDARFLLRGPIGPDEIEKLNVAIVAVDDASVAALGRWPWPRAQIAEVVEAINRAGAKTIGLDIVFSESESSALEIVSEMGGISESARKEVESALSANSPDAVLAQAIRDAGNVVTGHFFYLSEEQLKGMTPLSPAEEEKLLISSRLQGVRYVSEDFEIKEALGVCPNIPAIAGAGPGSGYFNLDFDADGSVRSASLVTRYKGEFYPSLALKTLTHSLGGGAQISLHVKSFGISHLGVSGGEGEYRPEPDETGRILVNFRGPPKTIPTYSAIDALRGELPEGALEGKIVLLGVTAYALFDHYPTSFGPEFPGVEIQANIIDNIINNDAIHSTNLQELLDILTMIAMVGFLSFAIPRARGWLPRALISLSSLVAYILFNYWLFSRHLLWVNLAYPTISWFLSTGSLMLFMIVSVERRYSSVRAAFETCLNPTLVDQLTQNPELLQFGGENKIVTLLFSDIRSFTNLSETLAPQDLARFLNAYMDPMTEKVLENHGTLDKYIGDAVMAIYGAPYPTPNHAADACQTALDMLAALARVKDACPGLEQIFPIKIGIGIHTGEVVVGNLGSSLRFAYTALGDNVNLASRLEGLTKMYGVEVVLSDASWEIVKDEFVCRELDLVRVKGKKIPLRIYELRGKIVEGKEKAFLGKWEKAMKAYSCCEWQKALAYFEQASEIEPGDKCCSIYVERCRENMTNPPPIDWEGVTVLTSK